MTTPDLCTLIATELISTAGDVHHISLSHGLFLAYAGDAENGKLTLSRKAPAKPSSTEIEVVQRDFAAASLVLKLPILRWQELERPLIKTNTGTYNAVRLRVWFGEQKEFPFKEAE